jgi:hypothetical protein
MVWGSTRTQHMWHHTHLDVVRLLLDGALKRVCCCQPLLCRLVRDAQAAPVHTVAGHQLDGGLDQLYRLVVLQAGVVEEGQVCLLLGVGDVVGGGVCLITSTTAAMLAQHDKTAGGISASRG